MCIYTCACMRTGVFIINAHRDSRGDVDPRTPDVNVDWWMASGGGASVVRKKCPFL